MKVLVLGSGGREHALVYALKKSKRVSKVVAAPGNGGISDVCDVFSINPLDESQVLDLTLSQRVHLVVIGPEAPLVAGIADALKKAGILVYGPGKSGAMLEGSKVFAKKFMKRHNIGSASFDVCSNYCLLYTSRCE